MCNKYITWSYQLVIACTSNLKLRKIEIEKNVFLVFIWRKKPSTESSFKNNQNFARNVNYTHAIVFHLRRAVMANVEVLVSGGGTVGHSAAQLVGPVPHNLREKQEEGHKTLRAAGWGFTVVQISRLNAARFKQPASRVTATHLCEVSHHASVDRSHSVAPVLHLVVPPLDGGAPAHLGAGHVQVLPAATRCRKQEMERKKKKKKMPQSSSNPV